MSKTNMKRIDVPLPGLVAAERRECERSEPTAPGGMPVREAEGPRPARPKPARNPWMDEMEKLRRENARLAQQLEKAEIIIDVQKKVSSLLGIPLKDSNGGGMNS